MKALLAALSLFFLCVVVIGTAQASWAYNENGGFGIYQPEGWESRIEGRSMTLEGPATDSDQSSIFLGSDWSSKAKDLEQLKALVTEETGEKNPESVTVSGLPGFRAGNSESGSLYVLRIPENFLVVSYELRGSLSQIEEGKVMLGSIEVRTRPNEGIAE